LPQCCYTKAAATADANKGATKNSKGKGGVGKKVEGVTEDVTEGKNIPGEVLEAASSAGAAV
jgi:hypothetical protein